MRKPKKKKYGGPPQPMTSHQYEESKGPAAPTQVQMPLSMENKSAQMTKGGP